MADDYICSDCGYTSPDLASLKTCPVCGGTVVETYEGIEKFEAGRYPDDLVEDGGSDDLLDDIELEDDIENFDEEEVAKPKRASKVHNRSGSRSDMGGDKELE